MSKRAREQVFGEGEGLFVAFERNLPHGGRDEGIASLIADERGHFRCAAAFKERTRRPSNGTV